MFDFLLLFNLVFIGSIFISTISLGQEENDINEKVPAPKVEGRPIYNQGEFNEVNGIMMSHGGVVTDFCARNMTHEGFTWVDYQQNIRYWINNTMYLAQFTINKIAFKIGGNTISTDITSCERFNLTRSQIEYNKTIPTFTCNISYYNIHIYPNEDIESTLDLTLIHRVQANWEQTNIKIEALLNFTHMKLFNGSGDELSVGEPFATEILYTMSLMDATNSEKHIGVFPTSYTMETLEYNLTLDNGTPLTVSKLGMKNDFTVYNDSGAIAQTGYSDLDIPDERPFAQVTHGFPNLYYKSIHSLLSDPEIIITHNRVSVETTNFTPLILALAVGVITIIIMRRKRFSSKN